jgi:hypothetical protein
MTMPDDWAPDGCTLPTAERPLRVAEFDELFTTVVRFERPQPTRLDLVLGGDAEAMARDLADRESQCCSFFVFDFQPAGDEVLMHIGVPQSRVAILDALEDRIAR